jgi:hypothetical protein
MVEPGGIEPPTSSMPLSFLIIPTSFLALDRNYYSIENKCLLCFWRFLAVAMIFISAATRWRQKEMYGKAYEARYRRFDPER